MAHRNPEDEPLRLRPDFQAYWELSDVMREFVDESEEFNLRNAIWEVASENDWHGLAEGIVLSSHTPDKRALYPSEALLLLEKQLPGAQREIMKRTFAMQIAQTRELTRFEAEGQRRLARAVERHDKAHQAGALALMALDGVGRLLGGIVAHAHYDNERWPQR